jgi:threonine/homoserine/homoserine lactone efflux protein
VTAGSALAFFGVAFFLIATPGQDTALTVRNTLIGGRRAGLSTAVGVCAGQCMWAVSTSAGVGAVIISSDAAFVTLKVLGSGFLVFLGVRSVLQAVRSPIREAAHEGSHAPVQLSASSALRQGLLSNLLNPKMVAFFASVLPQFADSFSVLLVFGLVFSVMTLTWLSAYALAVVRAAPLLRNPRVRRTIEAVTGIVLIALGARLATGEVPGGLRLAMGEWR